MAMAGRASRAPRGRRKPEPMIAKPIQMPEPITSSESDGDIVEDLRASRNAPLRRNSKYLNEDEESSEAELSDVMNEFSEDIDTISLEEPEDVDDDNLQQFRANRKASLGGGSMRDLIYNSINGRDETNDKNGRKNTRSCSEVRRSLFDQRTGAGPSSSVDLRERMERSGMRTTEVSASFQRNRKASSEVDLEGPLRTNRAACYGEQTKNIIKNKRDILKKRMFLPNIHDKGTVEQEDPDRSEDFRANRTACLGGQSVKESLIYDRQTDSLSTVKTTKNSSNRVERVFERPGARGATRDVNSMAKNRAASMDGSTMRSLLYGPTTTSSSSTWNLNQSGSKLPPIKKSSEYQSKYKMYSEGATQKSNRQPPTKDNSTKKFNRFCYEIGDRAQEHEPSQGLGGETMKRLIYGKSARAKNQDVPEPKESSTKKITQVSYDQKTYEDSAPAYNGSLGGKHMKSLLYSGGSLPWNGKLIEPSDVVTIERHFDPEDIDFLMRPPKVASRAVRDRAKLSNFSGQIERSLVPYDYLKDILPDFDNNLERAAVNIKYGKYIECVCDEGTPCIKHLDPYQLQYFNEATNVLMILDQPATDRLDRRLQVVEKSFAEKYPNYYEKIIEKFPRKLNPNFEHRYEVSKTEFLNSFRKVLGEEQKLLKNTNCKAEIGVRRNMRLNTEGGKLDREFTSVCLLLRNEYPLLFIKYVEEHGFHQLAYEKCMVQQNILNLITISKLDPNKLKELEKIAKKK